MREKLVDTKPNQPSFVKQYLADESGATAIEYGLMSALIGVMCISAATALGGSVSDQFTYIASLLSGSGLEPEAGLGPAEGAQVNSVN